MFGNLIWVDTGRSAVGRAGTFNPEELGRTFLPVPALRDFTMERLRSFRS